MLAEGEYPFFEHMLGRRCSGSSSASVTKVTALVPKVCVDILATPKEETKMGACDVIQAPNITTRSVDALHTFRPPQYLTARGPLFNHGRDCVCGEGRHHDWLCRFRNRIRAGVTPLGVTQSL